MEFPDGRKTLARIPARFHKKLWIKTGAFLIVDHDADAEGGVTAEIAAVLYADHVKQLQRIPGVWCAGKKGGGEGGK